MGKFKMNATDFRDSLLKCRVVRHRNWIAPRPLPLGVDEGVAEAPPPGPPARSAADGPTLRVPAPAAPSGGPPVAGALLRATSSSSSAGGAPSPSPSASAAGGDVWGLLDNFGSSHLGLDAAERKRLVRMVQDMHATLITSAGLDDLDDLLAIAAGTGRGAAPAASADAPPP